LDARSLSASSQSHERTRPRLILAEPQMSAPNSVPSVGLSYEHPMCNRAQRPPLAQFPPANRYIVAVPITFLASAWFFAPADDKADLPSAFPTRALPFGSIISTSQSLHMLTRCLFCRGILQFRSEDGDHASSLLCAASLFPNQPLTDWGAF